MVIDAGRGCDAVLSAQSLHPCAPAVVKVGSDGADRTLRSGARRSQSAAGKSPISSIVTRLLIRQEASKLGFKSCVADKPCSFARPAGAQRDGALHRQTPLP